MLKRLMAIVFSTAIFFSTVLPATASNMEVNNVSNSTPIRTTFQVAQLYSPGMHVPADSVMVYPFSLDGLDSLFDSWKDKGYQMDAMITINHDWFGNYVNADPENRSKEIQQDKNGNNIDFIDGTHYMVPTENWIEYTWNFVEKSMDHGAKNIILEEPDQFKRSGYSQAFKEEWQAYYGEPWQDPETNQETRFKSERLKVHLMERFIKTLAQRIKQKNPEAKVYIATHSVMSYNAGNIVSGGAYYANIPEVDGIIGQCWTDTAKQPIPYKGGSAVKVFESAFVEYSSMVNLTSPTGKEFFALADPKADDGTKTWREYEKWWKQTVAAQLLQKDVKQFELFPWPDRSFAGAPDSYKTIQLSVFNALEDMFDKGANLTTPATKGITVALSDTLSWQYGFGSPDTVASFYGMTIPLVEKGIPVKIMPLENIKAAADLEDTKILMLSYDSQKPTSALYNQAIAQWVRDGGVLLYIGSYDPFNDMNLWWKEAGFNSPYEHLLNELGISGQVTAGKLTSGNEVNTIEWQINDGNSYGEGVEIPKSYSISKFTGNIQPLFKSGNDVVAYEKQIGRGHFIDIGIASSIIASSAKAAEFLCNMVEYACGKANINYVESDRMSIERGNYRIYETLGNEVTVSGKYIDLFDDKLSVVTNKLIAPDSPAMLYDISGLDTTTSPKVGFTGGEVVGNIIETAELTELTIKGPSASNSATRIISNNGLYPQSVTARLLDGSEVSVYYEWENSTKSLFISTPNSVEGVKLSVEWGTAYVEDTPKMTTEGVLIETNSNNRDSAFIVENTANANALHRFADDNSKIVYKINMKDYPDAKLKLDLACNYLVNISSDGVTWKEALNSRTITGQDFVEGAANREKHLINPADFGIAADGEIYIMVTDSNTSVPGWGGFIYSIEIFYKVPADKFEIDVENPEMSIPRGETGINYISITNRSGEEKTINVNLSRISATEDKIFFEAGKTATVSEVTVNIDPNTPGELQYMPEELQNGSQVPNGDSWIRYCDLDRYVVYKLPLASGYTAYNILLDIDNEYEFSLSADGINYELIGREERQVGTDISPNSNRQVHTIPVDEKYISQDGFVYLKIEDSHKSTGYGAEIFKIQVQGVNSSSGGAGDESTYLVEDSGSNVVPSEPFRYADADKYFVYRLPVGRNFTSAFVTLLLQNEFEVSASSDGTNFTVIGREERKHAELPQEGNLEYRTYDITDYVNVSGDVYIKIGDSHKEDGYGGILRSLKLFTETASEYEDSIQVAGGQNITLVHNQTVRIPVIITPQSDSSLGSKQFSIVVDDGSGYSQNYNIGYSVTAPKPIYEVVYTTQQITVDGIIQPGEWEASEEILVSTNSRDVLDFGTVWGNESSEADITSRYKIKWDNDKLFISETRTDDVFEFTENGGKMYLSDANMLFLDLYSKNDGINYKEGDYSVMFSASGTDGNPHVFMRKGTNSEVLEYPIDDLVEIASVIGEGTYTMELAIPWTVFDASPFTPANDRIVSMTLLATDNDGEGNWGQIMWVGNGDEQANWAKMKFTGRPDTEEPGTGEPGSGDTGNYIPIADVEPVPTIDGNGNVKVELKPSNADQEGIAAVRIEKDTLSRAFDMANINQEDVKSVTIDVKDVEGAAGYKVEIPAEALSSEVYGKNIIVKTSIATIILPENMLANMKQEHEYIELTVVYPDIQALSKDVREAIGSDYAIEVNIAAAGEKIMWKNPQASVEIQVDCNPEKFDVNNAEYFSVWFIDSAGNRKPVVNARYSMDTEKMIFNTNHFSIYSISAEKKTFSDLDNYEWARKEIEVLASKGVINGVSNESYAPEKNITRADFISLLVRTFEIDAEVKVNFDDVSLEDYFYREVGIAKAVGLAKGVGDNMFNPYSDITREDMMVLVCNILKAKGKLPYNETKSQAELYADFDDVSEYAKQSVAALVDAGIIKGDGKNINPKSKLTRAEAAAVIYRIYML